MRKQVRPLLIAEAANPEWASVPLVGWSMATAIARQTDAHIVTQVRNRDAFVRAGLKEGSDFTAIDTERLSRPLWKTANFLRGGKGVGWTIQTAIASLSYPYFERLVWRQFGPRIQAGEFDIVHRITPLTPTAPSLIAGRVAAAGVPFVLGPLNGGVPWPKGFDEERRKEREWLSYIRGVYKWLPGYRNTTKFAAAILCGSRFTQSDLPARYASKYLYEPENGIEPGRFTARCSPHDQGPLRLCFIGRLVPYKGADIVLKAAESLLRSGAATVDIVGDGPMKADLQKWVVEQELDSAVRFHGWVQHGEVQHLLASCHALAFPSVREFGGGVVLEAMAVGLVPIVADYAGPGELVDDAVGFKIPMGDRNALTRSLANCLAMIAADPSVLAAKSTACVERIATQYTWDAKASRVVRLYEALMAKREPRLIEWATTPAES